MAEFGLSFKQFKGQFFDFEKVINKADDANRRGLARFGGAVRTTARRSIKKRKKRSTAPNQPSSHDEHRLRKGIFFAKSAGGGGVIIGPIALKFQRDDGYTINTKRPTETLEEGGRVGIHEVKYHGQWMRVGAVPPKGRNGLPRRVRWVTIEARPYMGPAFKKTLPQASSFWQDSIKA